MTRDPSLFFKLFPPPRFLTLPHAGLDISDDGIYCIRYDGPTRNPHLGLFAALDFPPGLVEGGDVRDEKEFSARLNEFARANNLFRVKVSIPEEKSYLFQTEVVATKGSSITQNIEFKLEENVPLAAVDALFYYDLLPPVAGSDAYRASVSVVPKAYIERCMALLQAAGMQPTAFEIAPKAIARAIVPARTAGTKVVVNIMRKNVGLYVVSDGVVCFTSTIGGGAAVGETRNKEMAAMLPREILRVYSYWTSRGRESPVGEIILVGRDAPLFEEACQTVGEQAPISVRLGNIWENAFNLEHYIPPISRNMSLEYAAAAGLAFDTSSE